MKNQNGEIIIVVDDDPTIRQVFVDLFREQYSVYECENGVEGLEKITQHQNSIVLVLLDIHMPFLNGYEILKQMELLGLRNRIPAVIMTADSDPKSLELGFTYGAVDVIKKPLQLETTQRRAENIIEFYRQKNNLEALVEMQTQKLIKQNEQYKIQNEAMMNILKDIITNRSIESEKHIQYVECYTEILAKAYRHLYPKSKMTMEKIEFIKKAAKIHDLGKITLPEPILKKKGRLLPEEMEYLKEHTIRGGEIVMSMCEFQNPTFLKISYNVCRYHHERFDGTGYPEGRKGDDIPIEAQIVSAADLIDALANVAINKEKIPIQQAIAMVLAGACGELSPRIKECISFAKSELIEIKFL